MKRLALLFLTTALPLAPALAAPATNQMCLDPDKPYHAKYLSGQDILVNATHGKVHPLLRVSTNCIGIDGGAKITFTAASGCLAVGDGVALKRPGEPVQTCQITRIVNPGTEPRASR
jgi:hypothetical protein